MNKYYLLIFTVGILSLINSCDPNKNDIIVNSEPKKDTTNKPHVYDIDKRHEKYIIFPNMEKVEELKADTTEYTVLNLKSYKNFRLTIRNYSMIGYTTYNDYTSGESSNKSISSLIKENIVTNSSTGLFAVNQKENLFTFDYRFLSNFDSQLLLQLNIDFKSKIIKEFSLKYNIATSYNHSYYNKGLFTSMKDLNYSILNDSSIFIKMNVEELKKSLINYSESSSARDNNLNTSSSQIYKNSIFNGNEEFEFTFSK